MSSTQEQTVECLEKLIAFDSVSRRSNEAITSEVLDRLNGLGFKSECTTYHDDRGVLKVNLVARRIPSADWKPEGSTSRGLAYFCHTDVVPADRWEGPGGDPFAAIIEDAKLYGRGACDMKGSLACMLNAAAGVDAATQIAPLWIVCTADEEVGLQGARRLIEQSDSYRDLASHNPVSLIGEPTRLRVVHAHKGLAGFRIESHGDAAHSSTGKGFNANLAMVPMLQKLVEINERCQSDPSLHDARFDPPTLSFNFGVSDHMNTVNIVPSRCTAWGCFRTMPEIDATGLLKEIAATAEELGLDFWPITGGEPLSTPIDSASVKDLCQITAPVSGADGPHTECYATDGSMLGELDDRIVCGPGDIAQAHTTSEFIALEQLTAGVDIYRQAIRKWCC